MDKEVAHHILTEDELLALMRRAMQEEQPRMIEMISEKLDARFELLGLGASDPNGRREIRKDMEFSRRMRGLFESSSTAIGKAVLMLAFVGLMALAGYGLYLRGAPAK